MQQSHSEANVISLFNIPSNTTNGKSRLQAVLYKYNRTMCFGQLVTIVRSTRATVRYMQRDIPEHNGIPLGYTLLSIKIAAKIL